MVSPVNLDSISAEPVARDLTRLRQTAGQVVGSVFFGTMLKTMQDSPLKGKVGHGGRGEEVFAAQLHGVLAERAGTAMQRGLGEVLYKRLEHQQELVSAVRARAANGKNLQRE